MPPSSAASGSDTQSSMLSRDPEMRREEILKMLSRPETSPSERYRETLHQETAGFYRWIQEKKTQHNLDRGSNVAPLPALQARKTRVNCELDLMPASASARCHSSQRARLTSKESHQFSQIRQGASVPIISRAATVTVGSSRSKENNTGRSSPRPSTNQQSKSCNGEIMERKKDHVSTVSVPPPSRTHHSQLNSVNRVLATVIPVEPAQKPRRLRHVRSFAPHPVTENVCHRFGMEKVDGVCSEVEEEKGQSGAGDKDCEIDQEGEGHD